MYDSDQPETEGWPSSVWRTLLVSDTYACTETNEPPESCEEERRKGNCPIAFPRSYSLSTAPLGLNNRCDYPVGHWGLLKTLLGMSDSKLDELREAEHGQLDPRDLLDLWGVVDAAETVWAQLGGDALMWNGNDLKHEIAALKFWLITQASLGGVTLQKTLFEY